VRHALESAPPGARLDAVDVAFLAAETRTTPDTVQEMIDAQRAEHTAQEVSDAHRTDTR